MLTRLLVLLQSKYNYVNSERKNNIVLLLQVDRLIHKQKNTLRGFAATVLLGLAGSSKWWLMLTNFGYILLHDENYQVSLIQQDN